MSNPESAVNAHDSKRKRRKNPWKCDCGYVDEWDHKRRHVKQCNGKKTREDPRLAPNVTTVLHICGMPLDIIQDWNIPQLDRLPNFLLQQPEPFARHTPWHIQRLKDPPELPSVIDILMKMSRAPSRFQGEWWKDTEELDGGSMVLKDFTGNVLNGRPEARRILNMSTAGYLDRESARAFQQRALPLLREADKVRDDVDIVELEASMNVTPRGTRTELHHDSNSHASVAVGMRSTDDLPLKLWILYPSTEIAGFGRIRTTADGVERLEHGAFLVHMPGDFIFVPPNSPHAVVALNTCYIYGISVRGEEINMLDPTSVLADMRGNFEQEEARERVLAGLRIGLAAAGWRRRVMSQLISEWGAEGHLLSSEIGGYKKLLDILADDFEKTSMCL